jgi:hypothetical protein
MMCGRAMDDHAASASGKRTNSSVTLTLHIACYLPICRLAVGRLALFDFYRRCISALCVFLQHPKFFRFFVGISVGIDLHTL